MIRKLGVILLACITLVPPAQCTGGESSDTAAIMQQALEHVEQGDIYFDQASYDQAAGEYNTAIELAPELAVAYWGRGRVYHFDRGEYSRAIDEYSKAVELDSQYTDAYFYRGLAQAANGVYDRAIPDFSKAIELDPGLSMAYNVRAWCYVHKAQWDQSSQLYLYQLFESDAGLAEAYKGKGWTSVRQTQWEHFAVPYLVRDAGTGKIEDEYTGNAPVRPEPENRHPDTPYVNIMPVSGPVGTKLYLYGWGFRRGEDGMTVTWDGEIIVCNVTAEEDGSLIIDGSEKRDGTSRVTVYVPESTQGNHIIGVYGSSFTPRGIVNDTVFEVIPRIKVTPEPSIKGTQVNIAGTGFASSENITVSLDQQSKDITVIADSNGSFNAAVITPTIKGREYTIDVSGSKGNSAQANFTVILAKPLPTGRKPDVAELYYNRGYAHFKKVQWALAIAEMESAYAADPALNRGSWNIDWALNKQRQWDPVIEDYNTAISLITGSATTQYNSGSEALAEELAQALADYRRAAEISEDTAFAQKAWETIEFIEKWSNDISRWLVEGLGNGRSVS